MDALRKKNNQGHKERKKQKINERQQIKGSKLKLKNNTSEQQI
jgi:hypothetical protein